MLDEAARRCASGALIGASAKIPALLLATFSPREGAAWTIG